VLRTVEEVEGKEDFRRTEDLSRGRNICRGMEDLSGEEHYGRYNKKSDTCSYYAETTAAAKMYLLRSGRLTLG
jgi:hypothetical protein